MKKNEEMRLKSTIYESTLSTADAVPLPRVGKGASGASRIGRSMKESGTIVSSTLFARAPYPPLTRSPFPNGEGYDTRAPLSPTQRLSQWGRQRGSGFAAKKGSQPRLAALGSPFPWKGLAWILPPSYGRRCPEGAEVGWGKRYPRHTAFPAWGRWRAERAG